MSKEQKHLQLAPGIVTEQGEQVRNTLKTPRRSKRPIWERIVELGAQIPEEEWATVPDDASINYKHYLYSRVLPNVSSQTRSDPEY